MSIRLKIAIILFVLFASCKGETEGVYVFVNRSNQLESVYENYYFITVVEEQPYRFVTKYRVFDNDSILKVDYGAFRLKKDELNKSRVINDSVFYLPYLSTKTNDTIIFSYDSPLYEGVPKDDIWGSRTCFLGTEDIVVQGIEFKKALKFWYDKGQVESISYFDKNFNLLKKEYMDGEVWPFTFERIPSTEKSHLWKKANAQFTIDYNRITGESVNHKYIQK